MNAPSVDLSKFTSPLLIPLPPSPPPKVRIPSRKPNGWISSIPRLSSSRFTALIEDRRVSYADQRQSANDANDQRGTTRAVSGDRGREVSAGTEGTLVEPDESADSGADLLPGAEEDIRHSTDLGRPRDPRGAGSGGGRRVSGAMQYALLPPSSSPERQPARLSIDRRHSAKHRHIRQDGSQHVDGVEGPSTATSDLDSERITTPLPHVPDMLGDPAVVRIVDTRASSSFDEDTIYGSRPGHNDDGEDEYQPEESFRSVSEISESDEGDDEGELERPEWLDEVLAERQADEEWMGYVRSQLNALFPDFSMEERYFPGRAQHRSDDIGISSPPEHYNISASQLYMQSAASYSPAFARDQQVISNLSLKDPVQAGRQAADHLPGVREEMGSLREEIERLRGVVGGLAEGLGRNRQKEVHEDEKQSKSGLITAKKEGSVKQEEDREEAVSKHGEREVGVVEQLLVKVGFPLRSVLSERDAAEVEQNADQIISLLRAIHELRYPGKEMTTLELLQRDNLVKLERDTKSRTDEEH